MLHDSENARDEATSKAQKDSESYQRELKKIQDAHARTREVLRETDEKLVEARSEVSHATADAKAAQSKLETANEKLSDQTAQINTLKQDLESLRTSKQETDTELSTVKGQKEIETSNRVAAETKRDENSAKLASANSKLAEEEKTRIAAESRAADREVARSALETLQRETEQARHRLQQEVDALNTRLSLHQKDSKDADAKWKEREADWAGKEKTLEEDQTRLRLLLAKEQVDVGDLEALNNAMTEEHQKQKDLCTQLRADSEELKKTNEALGQEMKDAKRSLEDRLRRAADDLEKLKEDSKKELEHAESARLELQKEKESTEKMLKEENTTNQTLSHTVDNLQDELFQLQDTAEQLRTVQDDLVTATRQCEQLTHDAKKADDTIGELFNELDVVQKESLANKSEADHQTELARTFSASRENIYLTLAEDLRVKDVIDRHNAIAGQNTDRQQLLQYGTAGCDTIDATWLPSIQRAIKQHDENYRLLEQDRNNEKSAAEILLDDITSVSKKNTMLQKKADKLAQDLTAATSTAGLAQTRLDILKTTHEKAQADLAQASDDKLAQEMQLFRLTIDLSRKEREADSLRGKSSRIDTLLRSRNRLAALLDKAMDNRNVMLGMLKRAETEFKRKLQAAHETCDRWRAHSASQDDSLRTLAEALNRAEQQLAWIDLIHVTVFTREWEEKYGSLDLLPRLYPDQGREGSEGATGGEVGGVGEPGQHGESGDGTAAGEAMEIDNGN